MIDKILIVHHTHADFGYTDHQNTAMAMLREYVDDALNAIERSASFPDEAQFRWTQEVFLPLREWWRAANSKKRARLIEAIKAGRFEACAMPVNVSGFADEREWEYMLGLMPDKIAAAAPVLTVMQNDINGISLRGVEMAYDRGCRYLWMGPNSYYGTAPQPAPFAFYWQIAPGKRVLTWCNSSYNDATFMFNENWRQGPVPAAHDLCYRPPEAGDIFKSDPAGLEKSRERLMKSLGALTGSNASSAGNDGFTKCKTRGDYPYKTLITSVAGQWRCDNDPPFAYLSDFVKAWNGAGYTPRLKLCTVGQAIAEFERDAGEIPVRSGVWTDYWSNGLAASPVPMSVARRTRRVLTTACDPKLGKMSSGQKKRADEVLYNLMMVGEHTFASWNSASDPDCPNTRGQIAEKTAFSYRALESAKMLLAERMRSAVKPAAGTVSVFSSAPIEKRLRLTLPKNCLRGEYRSLLGDEGEVYGLIPRPGMSNFQRPENENEFSERNVGRTFGDACENASVETEPIFMKPASLLTLRLSESSFKTDYHASLPEVLTDDMGWPNLIAFNNDVCPLIKGACGAFRSIGAKGLAPRWTFKDVFDADGENEREALYKELFIETDAEFEKVEASRDADRLVFTQRFAHPSLRLGRRTLYVDLATKRAELNVYIDRLPSYAPEIFYIGFNSPVGDRPPMASLTGMKFRTFEENLPGACRDFMCIDGWLGYGEGEVWNWFSRDASLVCVGRPRPSARRAATPSNVREFWAQAFDNTWDTNFNPNAWGAMAFGFDIAAGKIDNPVKTFEALASDPAVMVYAKNQE